MKHTYQVSGMTCNGCRSHVEQTLKEVQGVSAVSVDLAKGEATVHIEPDVSLEILKEALKNDGGRYDIHPVGTHETHPPPNA